MLIYISVIQLDSTTVKQFAIHLQNYTSGNVTVRLTNQLTGKLSSTTLGALETNDRYTKFGYQPTDLIEGMYIMKFEQGDNVLATRLCYISNGSTPLSESEYKSYTTGDTDQDYVYIP